MQNKIIIEPEVLRKTFPYFKDIDDLAIESAAKGVGSFISTTLGNIELVPDLQIRGNYLACCHLLFLQLNPAVGNGLINSAAQGSESLSYQSKPVKNWFDYQLGLTPYGLELLAILQQVQPIIQNKPNNINPYYSALNGN